MIPLMWHMIHFPWKVVAWDAWICGFYVIDQEITMKYSQCQRKLEWKFASEQWQCIVMVLWAFLNRSACCFLVETACRGFAVFRSGKMHMFCCLKRFTAARCTIYTWHKIYGQCGLNGMSRFWQWAWTCSATRFTNAWQVKSPWLHFTTLFKMTVLDV